MLSLTVFADDAAQQQQVSGWQLLGSLWPFAAALVLMYLLMFRPQQKREKQAQMMRDNVRVGDEVCTAGGLVGIVIKVSDDTVVLETGGERSKIRVKKWAIHENITQMEEAAAAEKERKAKRAAGIATAAADDDKKKKNSDD
ncbi:MAG: preprotein translocase subunit YajC [Oscillospiraceae bacterium]|nr:preprotein translocase subunit YajC [Oscillospiraceae bacterium]